MATKNEIAAEKIIELVGGKENITFFTHCVTRLRFNIADKSLIKEDDLKKVPGVLGCQWSGTQYQVIVGQAVSNIYEIICSNTGLGTKTTSVSRDTGEIRKKFSASAILDGITGSITPMIPVMVGTGMIKVLILLLTNFGVLTADSATIVTLTFISDSAFYFLPVLLGAFSAKKFGLNLGIGMLLGAMLIHPVFVGMVSEGVGGSIFGLPIHAGSYSYSIFPVLLAVFVASRVEKVINKIIPDMLRTIAVPFLTILVMAPVTLVALAPIGSWAGELLATAIVGIYNTVGFLGVAILGALMPLLVMTGMHQAFVPYLMQSLTSLGYEPLLCPANILSNFSTAASCLAVGIKSKDIETKQTAFSCATTAFVGGIIEPALFGIIVPLKTPLYGTMIGGFAGALTAGLLKVYIYNVPATAGIFGIAYYIGPTAMNVVYLMISAAVGCAVSFASTMVLFKNKSNDSTTE